MAVLGVWWLWVGGGKGMWVEVVLWVVVGGLVSGGFWGWLGVWSREYGVGFCRFCCC